MKIYHNPLEYNLLRGGTKEYRQKNWIHLITKECRKKKVILDLD